MRIDEIRLLKNGRFGLFTDGEFLLSLDEETYLHSGVRQGDTLSAEQLNALHARAQEKTAREKALTYLSFRDHSKAELCRKIARKTGEEAAQKAAEQMEELGLVDDAEYARRLARELLQRRLYGRRRALYAMQEKGIARELAEEAVEEADGDAAARARALLQKKFPRKIANDKDRKRASDTLARAGYDWDDIRQAVRALSVPENEMDEENAD